MNVKEKDLQEIEKKQYALLVRLSAKVGRNQLKDHQKTMLDYLEKKYGEPTFAEFCRLTM